MVSQKVQNAEHGLTSLQSNINLEKETIRVLSAEWDYLNRPERLEELAAKYLEIKPVHSEQIVVDAYMLPDREVPVTPLIKPQTAIQDTVNTQAISALYESTHSKDPPQTSQSYSYPTPSLKPRRPQNTQKKFQNLLNSLNTNKGSANDR